MTLEPPSRRWNREKAALDNLLLDAPNKLVRMRWTNLAVAVFPLLVAVALTFYVDTTAISAPWVTALLTAVFVIGTAGGLVDASIMLRIAVLRYRLSWAGTRVQWLARRSAVQPDEAGTDGLDSAGSDAVVRLSRVYAVTSGGLLCVWFALMVLARYVAGTVNPLYATVCAVLSTIVGCALYAGGMFRLFRLYNGEIDGYLAEAKRMSR